ncbi:hypothetical protein DES52_116110 [Deinococcus yavapaiensis KR-236]|uniref:Uncharacterized protein n=1 Tax=Deinococcus yavapaiensis KR-236 TaxID=694435 RepID=A0A318S5F7_9DEIO|nr:hypothetical protein DES52_116110 [Deinococcus yavapaiensis KR-236]
MYTTLERVRAAAITFADRDGFGDKITIGTNEHTDDFYVVTPGGPQEQKPWKYISGSGAHHFRAVRVEVDAPPNS